MAAVFYTTFKHRTPKRFGSELQSERRALHSVALKIDVLFYLFKKRSEQTNTHMLYVYVCGACKVII